mmetsp:Transcript_20482/g.41652  ORF Transcript_20482/g.41652 Transcript_20482/m.41652 type:complete len:370 (-) Transcript_20482:486-1595(-)|eukprot:CAMPEP_0174717914 /NCGR_PEP_ID=MMETSP1094-20130205/27501_1 /TAXON_ID=156173 /ORGANISM="Chrysochromulina brevifilum, Strain UTEX LB 985" /LENGTH=369 /DNA_ID=CAMNT_0015917917 /DNA_START=93 /DNA_END=1202 /DNA_ORIENTATION=-
MGAGGEQAPGAVPMSKRSPLRSLFTTEDPYNMHKSLGLFTIFHFIYRFSHAGDGDMAFTSSLETALCLSVHALLSVSAFVFRIPKKRIADGDRIWPEYRWHSVIFAYRSLACLAVTWFEKRYQLQPTYLANAAIVLGTHMSADFASWSVGEDHSSSVQDLAAPQFVRFFFSFMQFQATATCLVGVRRFSTQFFYVWLIQATAFLMTLRRKNVVPPKWPYMIYAGMLIATYLVHMHEYTNAGCWLLVNIIGHTAAYLRLGLRISKYAIWAGFALVLYALRDSLTLTATYSASQPEPFPLGHTAAFAASACAVFAVGARKVSDGKSSAISRTLDAVAIAALAIAAHEIYTTLTMPPPPPPPPPPRKFFGLF